MHPRLKDTPEWAMLEAAVVQVSKAEARLATEDDGPECQGQQGHMLIEFALVGYEVPFDSNSQHRGRYFEFHSSEMPHTAIGLLEQGAELVSAYYGQCGCE